MKLVNENEVNTPSVPQPLANPDFSKVQKMVIEHVAGYADSDNCRDDEDDTHYLFEAAVEAIYGPNIWKWINKQR